MEVVGSVVGADKLRLTPRPAGETRFTRKTMSTRSGAHMHRHGPARLFKYSCEDRSHETATTSNPELQIFKCDQTARINNKSV
ncbi:Hypothetical predicted protein [Xyrichtys novacula]|uniref:Uncharacterized protein n=1 Tax=Xyrichtys novacula TaxID=13765 RepID=A0AAV1HG15_XYRNO|nr:Hypothetical predicted protein [Xyrichtys novacula]